MARRRRTNNFSIIRSLNEVNEKVNRGSHISIVLVIVIILATLMIGFIWQKVRFNHLVQEIEDLKKQELTLLRKNEKSRAVLLNLMNDARIIEIAKNNLNMVATKYEVIKQSDDFLKYKKRIDKIFEDDDDQQQSMNSIKFAQ